MVNCVSLIVMDDQFELVYMLVVEWVALLGVVLVYSMCIQMYIANFNLRGHNKSERVTKDVLGKTYKMEIVTTIIYTNT